MASRRMGLSTHGWVSWAILLQMDLGRPGREAADGQRLCPQRHHLHRAGAWWAGKKVENVTERRQSGQEDSRGGGGLRPAPNDGATVHGGS